MSVLQGGGWVGVFLAVVGERFLENVVLESVRGLFVLRVQQLVYHSLLLSFLDLLLGLHLLFFAPERVVHLGVVERHVH